MENRRQFTRVLYSIEAQLKIENEVYNVTIEDMSLNGVLVKVFDKAITINDKRGVLTFKFNESDNVVIHITVIHNKEDEVGLRVNAIDIDSLSILRRFIELNIGDDEQVHKELGQLTRSVNY